MAACIPLIADVLSSVSVLKGNRARNEADREEIYGTGNSRTTAPKYYKVGATHARVRAKPRVQQGG